MAGIYNFTIKQAADFSRTIIWKDSAGNPINLTGYTARLSAKIRITDATPVLNLTSGVGGKITLGTNDGVITITLNETDTRALTFTTAIYDLFMNDIHLLSGEISIERTTING